MTCRVELAFRSCYELRGCLAAIGYNVEVAQLTSGELIGKLIARNLGVLQLVQIESNQGILFYGESNSRLINFALETSNNLDLHRVQGHALPKSSIAGFNLHKTEVYFSISPHSKMHFANFAKDNLLQWTKNLYGDQGHATLSLKHYVKINPQSKHHIHQSINILLHEQVKTSHSGLVTEDLAIEILQEVCSQHPIHQDLHDLERSQDLVRDLVKSAYDKYYDKPVSINELTKDLLTSKSVLSSSIKKSMGLSPLRFLRNIRLEQVRSELIKADSSTSVGSVARQFGFPNRGHFCRYYHQQFGELPGDTLKKC